MVQPTQAQIAAAIKELRSELAAMSTWLINYNSKISDDQMQSSITKVLTAALNVPPANPPAKKTPLKGK